MSPDIDRGPDDFRLSDRVQKRIQRVYVSHTVPDTIKTVVVGFGGCPERVVARDVCSVAGHRTK